MTTFAETSLPVVYVPESDLGFGYDQKSDNPKDGLYLFGPADGPSRAEITVGVVGTVNGINHFKSWLEKLNRPVLVPPPTKREKTNRPHLSDFPGFQEAFGVKVDPEQLVCYEIDPVAVEETTMFENHHEAVARTVNLFLNPVMNHDRNEERTVDVWIFVVPEIVFETCRPNAGARRPKADLKSGEFARAQKKRSDLPLLASVVDESIEDVFDDVADFHRQIKARMLEIGQTSQLIRETTLAPDNFLNAAGKPKRGIQDIASVAWNLATGLYYKTQANPPWKIANMRPGVCYVGLVFKLSVVRYFETSGRLT